MKSIKCCSPCRFLSTNLLQLQKLENRQVLHDSRILRFSGSFSRPPCHLIWKTKKWEAAEAFIMVQFCKCDFDSNFWWVILLQHDFATIMLTCYVDLVLCFPKVHECVYTLCICKDVVWCNVPIKSHLRQIGRFWDRLQRDYHKCSISRRDEWWKISEVRNENSDWKVTWISYVIMPHVKMPYQKLWWLHALPMICMGFSTVVKAFSNLNCWMLDQIPCYFNYWEMLGMHR